MTESLEAYLKGYIHDVPDFPKEGIVFKDITPLLKDAQAFKRTIDAFCDQVRDQQVNTVVGIESRGFIFGAAVALQLGAGFVPVRKIGKLPRSTNKVSYSLEYGEATLEVHQDAIDPDSTVLVVDDVLATGGTARAVQDLVSEKSAHLIGFSFVLELDFLSGRDKLSGAPIHSLLHY